MPKTMKLSPYEKSSQTALWGPLDRQYEEPDWEALELQERALQGLHETHYEEES